MKKIFLRRLIAKMLVVSMMFLSAPQIAFAEESGEEPIVDGGGEVEAVSGSAIEVTPSSEYNLTVKDIYSTYDSEGNFIEQVEQIRSSEVVPDGFTYSFDPLDPSVFAQYYVGDYYNTNGVNQSGTVNGNNVTIVFFYWVPDYCVFVADMYGCYSQNGYTVRENKLVRAGQPYSYDALPDFQVYDDFSTFTPSGAEVSIPREFTVDDWTYNFTVDGESTISGVVTKSTDVEFRYKATNDLSEIKVIDDFENTINGSVGSFTRGYIVAPVGQPLTINALDLDNNTFTDSNLPYQNSTSWINFSLSGKEWVVDNQTYKGDTLGYYMELSDEEAAEYGSYLKPAKSATVDMIGKQESGRHTIAFQYRLSKSSFHNYTLIDKFASGSGSYESVTRVDEPIESGSYANCSPIQNATYNGEDYEFDYAKVTEILPNGDIYTVRVNQLPETMLIDDETIIQIYYKKVIASTPEPVTPEPSVPETVSHATVKGQLTYADGKPVANKKVEIHSEPRYTYTDELGYYSFENVEVGEHTLTIYDNESIKLLSCTLEVKETESNTVEVVFKNDCEVTTDTSDTEVIKVNAILSVASPTPVPNTPEQNETTPTESPSNPVIETPVTTEPTPTPSEPVAEKKHYIIQVYDYIGNVEVRESKEVEEGTYYSYDAVDREGWTVIGDSHYEGYVNGNINIEFHYTENAVPTPKPNPDVTPDPKPSVDAQVVPIVTPTPEPKPFLDKEPRTGDTSSDLPLQVMIVSLMALIGLFTARRKNKR